VATTRKPAAKKAAPTRKSAPATKPVPAQARAAKPGKAAEAGKPKASAATKMPKAPKADKPKKPKLVRDSFTIPKPEYAAIDALKARAATSGRTVKKSELLRAGLMALSAMGDAALAAALAQVPAIKTGRPAKA
jgi:hypothetical protein